MSPPERILSLPPHTVGSVLDLAPKMKACNCKRSNCLKLYCECFSFGVYCSPDYCNCVSCFNIGGSGAHAQRRLNAIVQTVNRNQHAFRSKAKGAKLSGNGCNCRKSHCLKKYCDCFQGGRYCSGCNCIECKNFEGNPDREKALSNFKKPVKHGLSVGYSGPGVNRPSQKPSQNLHGSSSFLSALPPSFHTSPVLGDGEDVVEMSVGKGVVVEKEPWEREFEGVWGGGGGKRRRREEWGAEKRGMTKVASMNTSKMTITKRGGEGNMGGKEELECEEVLLSEEDEIDNGGGVSSMKGDKKAKEKKTSEVDAKVMLGMYRKLQQKIETMAQDMGRDRLKAKGAWGKRL